MKKHILKINTFILSFFITMPTYLMHVEASEELVIKNISNAILSIVSWFAYAIALGALIFFGIKYMMSGANEKANLKGMLPKYLIGMALIVFCFVIASGIAEIAGNDDAREIIDVGKEAGDHFVGESGGGSNPGGDETGAGAHHNTYANGKVEVITYDGAMVDVSVSEDNNHATFTASETNGQREKFTGWIIEFPDGTRKNYGASIGNTINVNISNDGNYKVYATYGRSSN